MLGVMFSFDKMLESFDKRDLSMMESFDMLCLSC